MSADGTLARLALTRPEGQAVRCRPDVPASMHVESEASLKDDGGYGADLAPQHLELIRASGIHPRVARERGYRTVTTAAELKRLGFSPAQCGTPALLIPSYDVRGERTLHQIRPDEPRIVKGKRVKYETPKGARLTIDAPPSVAASGDLRRGDKPLFITEGFRKADAGASAGLCIIALPGVWGFRGTNEDGGRTANVEWEHIHLRGRVIYICFDSDVMTKPQVAAAMMRLQRLLDSRGANTRLIYLPSGPGGEKVGLDDFLAQGKTVDDLLAFATDKLRPIPAESGESASGPYFVEDGCTYWNKDTLNGQVPTQLANFAATITRDTLVDDGVEHRREYAIAAQLGEVRRETSITASVFAGMNWPNELLGAGAIVQPGLAVRDHLRCAIQKTSGPIAQHTVHAHTGWRFMVGIGWVYLHAGGALGPKGPEVGIDTRLPPPLARCALPAPPSGKDLVRAIRSTIKLLRLGKAKLTYAMLATAVRAALGDCDFTLFIVGETGTYKTEATTLMAAFFGPGITAASLPGAWSGTGNSLEVLAFYAKDMLFVVDDFAPTGSRQDVARMHATAERLIRAQGNRAGRSRLNADASLSATREPRAMIVSSGEDVPAGKSVAARCVLLAVRKGDISVEELTRCQGDAAAGEYAKAMSAFLCSIAAKYDEVHARFVKQSQALRSANLGLGAHSRTPSNLAGLQAAFEEFLAFAESAGTIDAAEAEAHRRDCWEALKEIGGEQAVHQESADQVNTFLDGIKAALVSGDAHIAAINGGVPQGISAASLGWRQLDHGVVASTAGWEPRGAKIGWVDGENLYLSAAPAYSVAQRFGSDAERLTVTKRTLIERMSERKLLVSSEASRKKHTTRVYAEGSRKDVLHLRLSLVADQAPEAPQAPEWSSDGAEPSVGPETGAQVGLDSEVSGPSFRPRSADARAGEDAPGSAGPTGPEGPELEGGGQGHSARRASDVPEVAAWRL